MSNQPLPFKKKAGLKDGGWSGMLVAALVLAQSLFGVP